MNDSNQNRLVTWKEIAAFLSCDVRTCLRWEKERGLPIHRPEGGSKSRVYAWKDELEGWLKGNADESRPQSASIPISSSTSNPNPMERRTAGSRLGKIRPIQAVAFIFVLAIIVFWGGRALIADRVPVDFHIKGSKLIILNQAGKTLWEYDTGLKYLNVENDFRSFFNRKATGRESEFRNLPLIVIRDIDNDGKNEVLFTPQTTDSLRAGLITCFDNRGRKRWSFEGGREMTFGKKTFSPDYWNRFDVLDFDGDGRQEVLIISSQAPDWPTQITLLSAKDGKFLGEYWNSGRIIDYLSADLDGDGKKELAVCGTNNEYRHGIIAIFDPQKIGGASPNTGEFHSPDLAIGTEKAYILLPRTDIDPVIPQRDWLNFAGNIELRESGLIYIETKENNIYFEIAPPSLECRSANFSNSFRAMHTEAVKAGRVTSVLDNAYLERLRTGLQYWNGNAWKSTPTWVR